MPDEPHNVHPLRPEVDVPAPRRRPRLKKLRLLVLLVPLVGLAAVSSLFGMMMAVAADLPQLESEPRYRGSGPQNTVLTDRRGEVLGRLTSEDRRLYVRSKQIAPNMTNAIIAIEDERFRSNSGVDLKGIGRAFVQDVVRRRAAQGGSTITQQFVKNALAAQDDRTVFQKLRESALAYHLTRKWGKTKILTEYLNSIYFGNGAYGIEAAAQTYFGRAGCGTQANPCASHLTVAQAALLAGVVASPSGFDPVAHPRAARARRDQVLHKMLEQGYVSQLAHDEAVNAPLPAAADVRPPPVDTKAPYFTSWVRQQLVDRYGPQRAFEGGLRVKTTIDLKLQDAAEQAVRGLLANPSGPTASLVAIDNETGEVRAMVSGTQPYDERPFNLATQGQRQPGSSFKPFILAQALREGIGAGSVWPSAKRTFCISRRGRVYDGSGKDRCSDPFVVNNFESDYAGQRTLAQGLTYSDNAVFSAVGLKVGTSKVARLARQLGVRTPVSTNPAMTLGGLRQGVTALDMAHAYESLQQGGQRITGSLGSPDGGPVGIEEVRGRDGQPIAGGTNRVRRTRVLPRSVAEQTTGIMRTVVSEGSGKRAALPGYAVAGKTGTTENSGDAWFVGFTDRMTVAVWVGYPDTLTPMETQFQGGPVTGGTFPALIWQSFMTKANAYLDARRAAEGLPPRTETATTPAPTSPVPVGDGEGAAPDADAGAAAAAPAASTPQAAAPAATAATPAPAPTPTPDPAPAPAATAATPAQATPTPAPQDDGAGAAAGAGTGDGTADGGAAAAPAG